MVYCHLFFPDFDRADAGLGVGGPSRDVLSRGRRRGRRRRRLAVDDVQVLDVVGPDGDGRHLAGHAILEGLFEGDGLLFQVHRVDHSLQMVKLSLMSSTFSGISAGIYLKMSESGAAVQGDCFAQPSAVHV